MSYLSLVDAENEVLREKLRTITDKAIAWVAYHNSNGGCSFDGWESDLRKSLKKL